MADTSIRQGDLTPGWTDLYARVEDDQGRIWDGTAFVAFVVADVAAYRVAMAESPAASGRYSAAFPATIPAGTYTWKIYKGAGTLADPKWGGPSTGTWDGTVFVGTAVDFTPVLTLLTSLQTQLTSLQTLLDSYAAITPAAVVADPVPTTGGFVIALAGGGPVPASFVWRNNSAWFTSGGLAGGKYPIATYSRLSTTTARLTFSPLLPATPADGDAMLLG